MKSLLIFVLCAAALGAGGYFWYGARAQAASAAPATPTVKAAWEAISLRVPTTGRVVANQDVDIKCKASGEIILLPFDVSDRVTKGSLILEVDPVYAQRAVKQAEATVAATQARVDKARENLRVDELALATERLRATATIKAAEAQSQYTQIKAARMKELARQQAGSQEEADLAESTAIQADAAWEASKVRLEELKTMEAALELKRQDIKLAEADLESDRIKLADARQQLLDTKVAAPIDGVVSARNVQIGQIIASGISNVGGGTTVITLSDLSRVFVMASVDESDIGKVAVEQAAVVTSDAFPGRRFQGKVVRMATRGVNVSNVVTFEVKIEVLGEKKTMLKPEMTTNVEIVAAEKDRALVVPLEAVGRQKGKRFVQVVKEGGEPEERVVEVGINDGVKMEISQGLAEGEEVVLRKGQSESRWRSDRGGGAAGAGGSPFAGRSPMGGAKK